VSSISPSLVWLLGYHNPFHFAKETSVHRRSVAWKSFDLQTDQFMCFMAGNNVKLVKGMYIK
jgi:hypothetical protein